MNARVRPDRAPDTQKLTPEQEAAAKAAGSWVGQLARTLKTCRLYDGRNPTVVRFKQDLSASLQQLIEEHGALRLRFTADDVLCEGVSLYPAKSRDDNLALPFFRDGIRTLKLRVGIDAAELGAMLDAVTRVTGQNQEDDDLVTLLWEAHLPHVSIDYVPGEADVGTVADGSDEGVPWPTRAGAEANAAEAAVQAAEPGAAGEAATKRSDDWAVGHLTAAIEADFSELESLAPSEVARFKGEYEAEAGLPVVSGALAVASAYFHSGIGPEEKLDVARFLPRVLRLAIEQGVWEQACVALELLDASKSTEWSARTFVQELLQPISITGFREHLERQESEEVDDFIIFASKLAENGLDLLHHVLAEVQNPRHQRQIIDGIVSACRDNPELLAPHLSDPRWFVVRNAVQVLGAIGGSPVVGLLEAVVDHPDPRIRQEVVAALKNVPLQAARPLLLRMLQDADPRMFCSLLGVLSQERDPDCASLFLVYLLEPAFEHRSAEERRAIYMAISATGGDEVLPELEAELHKGGWFSRGQDADRQDVARCIARIGTAQARAVLERGAASRRGTIRKACEGALSRFD